MNDTQRTIAINTIILLTGIILSVSGIMLTLTDSSYNRCISPTTAELLTSFLYSLLTAIGVILILVVLVPLARNGEGE